MNALPSSRVVLVVLALLAAPGQAPVLAQVGPPVRLVPQGPAPQADPAFRPVPPAPPITPGLAPIPAAPPPRGEVVPRAQAVRVDPLQAPDPSNIGLLDASRGGLPFDMWRGSRRATVQALMPLLPASAPSPAMQALMRRLLLSAANPPGGPGGGPPLLGLRVERLAAAGRIGDMAELLKGAGSRLEDPALAQARIDAALLAGDTDQACAGAKQEMGSRPLPGVAKVAAFCQAIAGEKNAAALAGDLLREQGVKDDAYFSLLDQLTGARRAAKLTSLKQASALHLAMLHATRQNIPDDATREAPPAVLRAIAASTNASSEARLDAAERSAAAGAIAPDELAQFYGGLRSSADERAAALKADPKRTPRAGALLFQAAEAESEEGKKLALLRRALAIARAEGRFVNAARVWQGVAVSIVPSGTLGSGAGDMARALLAVGELNRARSWMEVDQAAGLELWPLTLVADGARSQPWTPQRLGEWLAANGAREGTAEAKARRAQLLFAVLEALGFGVPDTEWDGVLASPARGAGETPAPAVWRAMRQAALERRVGEAVLAALVALGDGGPGRAHPTVVATAIEALRAVRLDNDARAIALEALIAGGL